MRLEHLCDLELIFRTESLYGAEFAMVRPYGGEEGTGYAEGIGTASGAKLSGKLRWVNHPHRRSDGAMLPDVHGIIATEDGALVMFALDGRTVFKGNKGAQILRVTFEVEAEPYRWLNNTVCVLEGVIGAEPGVMRARVYICINELIDEA